MTRILLAPCAALALAACGSGGSEAGNNASTAQGANEVLPPLNTTGFAENGAAPEASEAAEAPAPAAAPARPAGPAPAQRPERPGKAESPGAAPPPPTPRRPPPPPRPPVDHNEMDHSQHNGL